MHCISSTNFLVGVVIAISFGITNGQNSDFSYPVDTNKFEGDACTSADGFSGICRKVDDCVQNARKLAKADLCSFSRNSALYCCVGEDVSGDTRTGEIDKFKNLRPADQICEHYHPSDVQGIKFFVQGTLSLAFQHPHMAAIGWTNNIGGVDWKCGGSVVTVKFILTAAHCTKSNGIPPDVARSGDLNLLVTENNTQPEDFKIIAIHVHPDYKDSEIYHDIALLKISPDHKHTATIKPACLWTSDEIPVQQLTGMGYGATDFSGPISNELYQGDLTVLSRDECSASMPASPSLPSGIIAGQLCAQDPNHVKDTCQGDSGGPMQFYNRSGFRSRPVIAGITSFGQYCAGRAPGVYTRVSSYLDWLEPILMSDFPIPLVL